MRKSILLLVLATSMAALVGCDPKKETVETQDRWPGYQPFPNGYGYMDTVQLKGALDSLNIAEIRQHAWSLFAGIMQPANNGVNWPTWYTWPNSAAAMEIKQMFGFGLEATRSGGRQALSIIDRNKLNTPIELDTLHAPYYPIPQPVLDSFSNKPGVITGNFIIPGKHFMDNGDIMIATESLSLDGYTWIQDNHLYDSSVVMTMYRNHVPDLNTPATYIVTKHMYWPVLAGQLGVVPVWDEGYFPYFYPGYAGYEKWSRLVAIDPNDTTQGHRTASVSYLHGVFNFDTTALGPISSANAVVHNISDFYYHKVTAADWAAFDDNDKAILNASSNWVYGKGFGVGDYLVTIAMHINTKELRSWTMQSAWWTDMPGLGKYSANQPSLPNAVGPWKHYDMVQAYGVPVINNSLERGTNPYIELVSHPMNTNCNNCHIRAGYPSLGASAPNGASYQNAGCKYLLEKLYPTTQCLTYYTRTDFQWIIADYTHAVPPQKK